MGKILDFFKNLFGGSKSPSGFDPRPSGDMDRDLGTFVEYVVRSLVDAPAAVKISAVSNPECLTFKIVCDKADIGKVIGREGQNIRAIRALVSGAASRANRKANVEVEE